MIERTNNNSDVAINLGKLTSRKRPYEVIPRELLQAPERIDMSLQALGLLLNLKSLSDNWEIRKSNLYKRYPFNKESSIRKAWSELEKCNYAKEIKKREGSSYRHYYFFDIVPFDSNCIEIPSNGKVASFLGGKFKPSEDSINYNNRFDESFEMLPRELLQTEELSLEAMALLCYLISYPDNYEFKKTNLYNSFRKNKRRAVSRMLDELIEKRYFLQFKKREGKKDIYKYIYRDQAFVDDEINKIKEILGAENFYFITNEMGTGKCTSQEKTPAKSETGKCTSQETPENQHSLGCANSSVHFQESVFECSKVGTTRIHRDKNTHLDNTHTDNTHSFKSSIFDDDDEKNIYKESELGNFKNEEEIKRLAEVQAKDFKKLCLDEKLRACAIFLEGYDLPFSDIYGVLKGIEEEGIDFTKKTLETQMRMTLEEQSQNGMTNFVKYFLIGLKRNSDFIAAHKKKQLYDMTDEEMRKYRVREKYLEEALGEIKESQSNRKIELYDFTQD